MSTIMSIICGLAAVAVFVWLLNKGAFSKIFGSARAQIGELGRAAESADPIAMARQANEDDAKNIQIGQQGLAELNAQLQAANDEAASQKNEQQRLVNLINAADSAGDPNKTVEGYALQLVKVEDKLETIEARQSRLSTAYETARKKISEAKERIKDRQESLKSAGAELKVSEATAAALSAASSIELGSSDAYDRAMQNIREKTYLNNAKANVSDIGNEQAEAEKRDQDLARKSSASSVIERLRVERAAKSGSGSAPAPAPAGENATVST